MNDPVMTLDTYDDICDYARSHSEQLDELRWVLGDCANTVKQRYDEKTVEDFARDIGQHKSTVYQYAKVSDYYKPSLRRRLIEEMPNINYSHMRDGLRFNDVTLAVAWLNEVSINGWSADEAARKLTERLGRQTRDSAEGVIQSYSDAIGIYTIEISVSKDDFKWLIDTDKVTIRAK